MATFHFNGQPLDHGLVANISSVLESAGVPNLLWDDCLLTVYGVPTIVNVSSTFRCMEQICESR